MVYSTALCPTMFACIAQHQKLHSVVCPLHLQMHGIIIMRWLFLLPTRDDYHYTMSSSTSSSLLLHNNAILLTQRIPCNLVSVSRLHEPTATSGRTETFFICVKVSPPPRRSWRPSSSQERNIRHRCKKEREGLFVAICAYYIEKRRASLQPLLTFDKYQPTSQKQKKPTQGIPMSYDEVVNVQTCRYMKRTLLSKWFCWLLAVVYNVGLAQTFNMIRFVLWRLYMYSAECVHRT